MKLLFAYLVLVIATVQTKAIAAENPLSTNYYERLGISASSSPEEIKKAYKKMAMKYHPDRHPELDRGIFQNINEAWDTLQNPQKRAMYDRTNPSSQQRPSGHHTHSHSTYQQQAKPEPKAEPKPGAQSGSSYNYQQRRPEPPPAVSKPPEGWFKNVNFAWDSTRTSESNILSALVFAQRDSFIYLQNLAENLDWRKPSVQSQFLDIVQPLIRGFNYIHRTNPSPQDFARKAAVIDNIFSFSKTAQFSQVFELMLSGEMADYLVKTVLPQERLKTHPDLGKWLSQAMAKDSAAVTTALIENFIPTLKTDFEKKSLLQKMISSASPANLIALASKIPLSTNPPDFSTEIRSLLARGNEEARAKMAKRFAVFLASKLTAAPHSEYYQIGWELNANSASKSYTPFENRVNRDHPVNQDIGFKSEAPTDWFKHAQSWNHQRPYFENLVIAMLQANDRTRHYLLNLAKGIDWRSAPVAHAFKELIYKHGFMSVYAQSIDLQHLSTFERSTLVVQKLMALPMTPLFPNLLDLMKGPLYVVAIQEMSRHEHWLNSQHLNIWIEKMNSAGSKEVTEAFTEKLLPELAENERLSAEKIILGKGAGNSCHSIFR